MQIPNALIRIAREARAVAVITGAGISNESGIPTFRGTGSAHNENWPERWRGVSSTDLATPEAFARDPRLVWEWYDWRRGLCAAAAPNAAHEIVTAMDRHYPEFLLITQNVDNLHRRAGTTRMVELHGNIFRARCTRTGRSFAMPDVIPLPEVPLRSPFVPDVLARPDIVWFGETYDERNLSQCLDFLSAADLIVVVGTSGMVPMPVYLTRHGVGAGAVAVDVNPEVSALTEVSQYYLEGKAGQVLPEFWRRVVAGD